MTSSVLILGAKGRLGLALAQAFTNAGWQVWGQIRPGDVPPEGLPVRWLAVDLHDTRALAAAAEGATVVVHALNPVYTNAVWRTQASRLMDAAIALARGINALLMFPGNVYNFGSTMPAVLREDTLQLAATVKGQVRRALEEQLRTSGVQAVVIRAGDFFGAGKGTWFDMAIASKLHQGGLTYPGQRHVSTAWAYLPDLARTFVAVAQRKNQLGPFDVFHFAGYSLSGQQWMDALRPIAREKQWIRADGELTFKRLPWPIIRLGALFMPTWAALLEMRYLWDTPHALANDKLVALIGPEPRTPFAEAVEGALHNTTR
jgi:nucleoside-diphosphate-sugar epimerase